MGLTEKLNILMLRNHINKAELARESGIPYTTIDGLFKKGAENVKLFTLKKLCSYFNCSLDYLADDSVTEDTPSSFYSLSLLEMDIVEKYRTLDSFGKNNVNQLLENEYHRCEAEAFWENVQTSLFDLLPSSEQEKSTHSFTSPEETNTTASSEEISTTPISAESITKLLDFFQNNPLPNAAHARTDIKPTTDDVKHDEDIMDDDNF